MKLYELANDLMEVMNMEDIAEEQKKEVLSAIEREIENKGLGLIQAFRNIDADIEVVDQEIKRLQQVKKQRQKQSENLKKYVLECLSNMNKKKIETPLGNLTTRKSTSVEVEHIELLPKEFVEEKTEFKVNKVALGKELKKGLIIEGARLVENTSLIIPKC